MDVNYIYALAASLLFGVCVTRPGMRLLTLCCHRFFDRVNWSLGYGLYSDGLYEYSDEFGNTDAEERALELAWFKALCVASAACAFCVSWSALCWVSGFGGVVWALVGSLLPTLLLFLVMGLGALLFVIDVVFGVRIHDIKLEGDTSGSQTSHLYTREELGEPTCFGDRLDDVALAIAARSRQAPAEAVGFFDRQFDSLKARLTRSKAS
jgi:hypothetical protein